MLIARFQCQASSKEKPTFSLLPHQLAPYRKYSVRSMAFSLLLAQTFCLGQDAGLAAMAAEAVADHSYGESRATGYLVSDWLVLFVASLRQEHIQLSTHFDLTELRSGDDLHGRLGEVRMYLSVLLRGPPITRFEQHLDPQLAWYASWAKRFLIGFPSQERGQCSA